MARTPEGTRLTQLHMRQQLALRAATIRDITKLYPMWELKDPVSYERFVAAMIMLVQGRATASAALAARYYQMFKSIDLGLLAEAVALAPPPPEAQVRTAVAATARAGVYKALSVGKPYAEAMREGLVQVAGSGSRLALNSGRETIITEVQRDQHALGWIRVSDGNPCAFCAMLLGRGPVYKSNTASFEAHDHCACGAEPYYQDSEWPAKNREAQDLYYEAVGTRKEGESVVNAMRRLQTTK